MIPVGKYPPFFYGNSKGMRTLSDAWKGLPNEEKRTLIVAALKLLNRLRDESTSSNLDIDIVPL